MITKLIRPELTEFKQYKLSPTLSQLSREIGLPVEKIMKIDSGENLYAENLLDKKLLMKTRLNFYPDSSCKELREKLADYVGYCPDWIVCGSGSDELIDLFIRIFVSQNEEIIVNPPTFPMYEFYGKLSGARVRLAERNINLSININRILKLINNKTKIIFVDSPGNPTSVITSLSDIRKLLEKQVIVIVDEAYYEYCGETVLPLIEKYPNLVVLRTLSKWAGLAGLRIGYAVANPQIIDLILKVKPPYNVNSAAQELASYVLENKEKFLRKIEDLVKVRSEIIKKLSRFPGLQVFPSQGAYILLRPKVAAQKIYAFFKKNGILIKIIDQSLLKNCIRINLMDNKSSETFILQLRRFYEI